MILISPVRVTTRSHATHMGGRPVVRSTWVVGVLIEDAASLMIVFVCYPPVAARCAGEELEAFVRDLRVTLGTKVGVVMGNGEPAARPGVVGKIDRRQGPGVTTCCRRPAIWTVAIHAAGGTYRNVVARKGMAVLARRIWALHVKDQIGGIVLRDTCCTLALNADQKGDG